MLPFASTSSLEDGKFLLGIVSSSLEILISFFNTLSLLASKLETPNFKADNLPAHFVTLFHHVEYNSSLEDLKRKDRLGENIKFDLNS